MGVVWVSVTVGAVFGFARGVFGGLEWWRVLWQGFLLLFYVLYTRDLLISPFVRTVTFVLSRGVIVVQTRCLTGADSVEYAMADVSLVRFVDERIKGSFRRQVGLVFRMKDGTRIWLPGVRGKVRAELLGLVGPQMPGMVIQDGDV